jgi:hypothetical protein
MAGRLWSRADRCADGQIRECFRGHVHGSRAGHDHSDYDRRNHGATATAAVARMCLRTASSATCGASISDAALVRDQGPRIALRLPTGATSYDVTTSSSSMVIVVVLGTSVVSVPPSPVLAVQVTSQCVVAVTV